MIEWVQDHFTNLAELLQSSRLALLHDILRHHPLVVSLHGGEHLVVPLLQLVVDAEHVLCLHLPDTCRLHGEEHRKHRGDRVTRVHGVPRVVERGRDLGELQGEVPLARPGGQLVLQLRQRTPALDRVGPVRGAADPVQQTLDQLSVLLLEHLLVRGLGGRAGDGGHLVQHVQDPREHDGVLVHQEVLLLLLAERLVGGEPVRLVLELLDLPLLLFLPSTYFKLYFFSVFCSSLPHLFFACHALLPLLLSSLGSDGRLV